MLATDTSTAAYDSIRDQLSEKQRKVRRALEKFGPMDNEAIARALEWPINTVTPRIKELRELGIVIEAGYTTTKSGRKAHLWKLKYEPPAPKPENKPASLF
jgi:predicted ArsR family transcriptional regulator